MSCNNVTEQAIFDKVVTRLTPWFPDTIMQQIKAKKELSAVEIIRLLSILPKQAYSDFLDIPNVGLVFPKDHEMHFLQSQEWFYLALNLTGTQRGVNDAQPVRIGALSSIVRRSIDKNNNSALFAPKTNNEVFRSSFSITIEEDNYHQYFPDTGNFLGDASGQYEPGVANKLPFVNIHKSTMEGLLPVSGSDGQMKWFITDSKTGAQLNLSLTCASPLLLQGPNENGILQMPGTGVNYMYYSFPYLKVAGTITADNKTYDVSGSGWLDHQGGVIKPSSGILAYLIGWAELFGASFRRLAWIWVQAQFPSTNTFITGASIGIDPQKVSKGSKFPWLGTIMKQGVNKFYTGELTVNDVFKSPDLDVSYVIDLSVTINDADTTFSLKSIVKDQRVFPADQGEIYEGSSNGILNIGKSNPVSGVGFIENMAFSSYEELVKQQYDAVGLKGPAPQKIKNLSGPIVTLAVISLIVLCIMIYRHFS